MITVAVGLFRAHHCGVCTTNEHEAEHDESGDHGASCACENHCLCLLWGVVVDVAAVAVRVVDVGVAVGFE